MQVHFVDEPPGTATSVRGQLHISTRRPARLTLRTLVLLHAFPIGANLSEPQLRSVPAGWRLIAPDLRGFGGSTSRLDERVVDHRLRRRRRRLVAELGIEAP